MIKSVIAGPNGKPVVLLGLSEANLTHLRQDRPVRVELSELGLPPTTVIIFTGATEESMIADLKEQLGTEPEVIDKKTPRDHRAHG